MLYKYPHLLPHNHHKHVLIAGDHCLNISYNYVLTMKYLI